MILVGEMFNNKVVVAVLVLLIAQLAAITSAAMLPREAWGPLPKGLDWDFLEAEGATGPGTYGKSRSRPQKQSLSPSKSLSLSLAFQHSALRL